MSMQISPVFATLGAVVTGVDLAAPVDDDTFAEIEAGWHRHAVLVFPGQNLDDAAQIAFSRRFGNLEKLITDTPGGIPEIAMLSNVKDDGTVWAPDSEQGLFLKGNSYWHTDSSFKRVPAKASLLSARVVPSAGGETEFADMRAAYDELDGETRDWLEDKVAVHSYAYSQGLVGGTEVLSEEEWAALPPVEHPLVRVHPATGRKSLYIGRHASHIVGEDEEHSRALLASLCEQACQPPRTWLHRWSPGDLVIWDNRCVLHRGHAYPGNEARVMARTTVAGDDGGNEWKL